MLFSLNLDAIKKDIPIKNGLYYGKLEGGVFPPYTIFLCVQEEKSILECFQPLKGNIITVLSDTLYENSTNKNNSKLLEGNKTEVKKIKGNIFVYLKKNISPFYFKKIEINRDTSKFKKLNEYRNRAYIFEDRKKIYKFLNDSLDGKVSNYFLYENLFYESDLNELADSLTHPIFLKEYKKRKEKIINEIINENR